MAAKLRIRYLERRKLADGQIGWVWNCRHAAAKGMQREWLGTDEAKAIVRAQQLNALWDEIRKVERTQAPADGTVTWLVDQVVAAPRHSEKSRKLQAEIETAFNFITGRGRANAGAKAPLARLRLEDIDGDLVHAYLAKVEKIRGLAFASRIGKWLRFLLGEAVRRRRLAANPMEGMRVRRPPPREHYFTEDQVKQLIAQALAMARPSLALAIRLAYDTGQREGDILRMRPDQYQDGDILVRQRKTANTVRIAALPELALALADWTRPGTDVLVAKEGLAPGPAAADGRKARSKCKAPSQAYSQSYFAHQIRKIFNTAGYPDHTFHDLRRSAVVRLAMAGCTIPEIASITGHSYTRCEQILEVYLPRSTALARQAIERILKARGTGSTVET